MGKTLWAKLIACAKVLWLSSLRLVWPEQSTQRKGVESGARPQARASSWRLLQTLVRTLDFILGVGRTHWRWEQVRGMSRELRGEGVKGGCKVWDGIFVLPLLRGWIVSVSWT